MMNFYMFIHLTQLTSFPKKKLKRLMSTNANINSNKAEKSCYILELFIFNFNLIESEDYYQSVTFQDFIKPAKSFINRVSIDSYFPNYQNSPFSFLRTSLTNNTYNLYNLYQIILFSFFKITWFSSFFPSFFLYHHYLFRRKKGEKSKKVNHTGKRKMIRFQDIL